MLRNSFAAALLLSCATSGGHAFAQLSFSPRQAAPLSSGSAIIAHGDFNNDGREDIVASVYSESASRNVAVLYLSTADGTYDAPKPLPAFVQAVGDFNHDGKLDFATSQFGSNPVSVYLGNGDGTFQPAKTFSGPSDSIGSLLAVDLNHDSKTDLVEILSDIGTSVSAIVQLWISNGDGTFTKGQSIVASTGVVANQYTGGAVTGDFDGDGKPDIALIYGYAIDQQAAQTVPVASTVQIFYGDGAGHLGSPIYFADPKNTFDSAPFAADLNNDGRSDIVAVASPPAGGVTSNGTLAVFVGNSNRTLSYKTLTNSVCAGPDGTGITVADFDGDGLNDLAYTAVPCNSNSVQTSLILRLGTGSGNFGAEQNIYQNPFQLAQPYAVRTTIGTRPDIVFHQFNGTTTDSFELLLNDSIGRFPNCGISVAEGISICQPQPKSASPVIFSLATAGPTPMRTAAVWVDGKKVDEQLTHAFSNYSFLDASIPIALGTHKVTIFGTGWDNTLQQKTFSVDVNSNNGCGAPTSPGVFLCQPAEDTTVSSPVKVVATATVTGKFARMEVWIDGVKKYTQTTNPVLTTTIPVSAGTHRFGVFAVNTAGTKWEAVANATVK